jgi:hypothetical protein
MRAALLLLAFVASAHSAPPIPFVSSLADDAANLHDELQEVEVSESPSSDPLEISANEVAAAAASVAGAVKANCSARVSDFRKELVDKGSLEVDCESACQDVDESSGGWNVYGAGPFRDDSRVCKAAYFAGVIKAGGGAATIVFLGEEPEFVSYATLQRGIFCFRGTAGCTTPPPATPLTGSPTLSPTLAPSSAPTRTPSLPPSPSPSRSPTEIP